MTTIGTVESLWRYPVKSMAGDEVAEAFLGFAGVYGDRCYAIHDAAGRAGFPYFNGPKQPQMLLYQPRFRHPELAAFPPNMTEAAAISPGVTYANAGPADLALDVVTPTGEVIPIDDPALLPMLLGDVRGEHSLSLIRSDRALTDCRPLSLISLQTIRQLGDELNLELDKLRFRGNIYADLTANTGYGEDKFVGKKLRIGEQATIMVLEKDPRCKMISLDPATGEHNPEIFRHVAQTHGADAGIYCAVLVEGIVRTGDPIVLAD